MNRCFLVKKMKISVQITNAASPSSKNPMSQSLSYIFTCTNGQCTQSSLGTGQTQASAATPENTAALAVTRKLCSKSQYRKSPIRKNRPGTVYLSHKKTEQNENICVFTEKVWQTQKPMCEPALEGFALGNQSVFSSSLFHMSMAYKFSKTGKKSIKHFLNLFPHFSFLHFTISSFLMNAVRL